MDTGEQNGGLK